MNYKFIFLTLLLCSFASQIALASPQARLVKDIHSGANPSISSSYTPPVSINNTLFFIANDGLHGEEIWQSDGTTEGTKLFIDLSETEDKEPANLTVIGNDLFVTIKSDVIDNQQYHELLKINTLTKEITPLQKAKDTVPNLSSGTIAPAITALHKIEDTLVFGVGNTEGRWEWDTWVSDGTVAGTKPAETMINPHSKWFTINDKFIFASGDKLWQSDGIETEAVEIITEDYENVFNHISVYQNDFLKINSALYFLSMGDERHGFPHRQYLLWRYDETGFSLVKELPQKPQHLVDYNGNETDLNFTGLVNANGKIVFTASSQYVEELWVSDGTAVGTKPIKSQTGIPAYGFEDLTNVNGTVFFTSKQDEQPTKLWKTDGTTEETLLVKTFEKGYVDNFISTNNVLFFTRRYLSSEHSDEVWQSDGTEAGTKLIHSSKSIIKLFNINNSLFFYADDGVHGKELWSIDDEALATNTCATGIDPQTIQAGEGTALWWWSDSALTANINQGIGSINLPTDFKWIYPEETTTYTVTATGADGTTATCDTTIVVEGKAENPPICEMGADPQIIRPGQGTALWWWSDNVSSASIDNDIGSVTTMTDYKWFYPTQTATYTMTAVSENGVATSCKTTIEVTNRH